MVKAFKTDGEALKALQHWAKGRPCAMVEVWVQEDWISVKLHDLPRCGGRSLRAAARAALIAFEKEQKAVRPLDLRRDSVLGLAC